MDFKAAGENVKALANQYRSVLQLGAALEAIGDLENQRIEAANLASAAFAQRDKAWADVKEVEVALAKANEDLDGVLNQIDEKLQTARAEADNLVLAADVTARGIVEDAKADVELYKTSVQAEIGALNGQRDSVAAELVTAQAKLEEIYLEIEDLRKRFG